MQARCQPIADRTRPGAWTSCTTRLADNGQKIRFLTVIDVFTREALWRSKSVIRLKALKTLRVCSTGWSICAGAPNNFICRQWRGVHRPDRRSLGLHAQGQDGLLSPRNPDRQRLHPLADRRMEHSPRGESFNGSLRDECLNVNWSASLAEAQRLVEAWRRDYNETRPHMTHNGKTPAEFAEISRPRHSGKVQIAAGF